MRLLCFSSLLFIFACETGPKTESQEAPENLSTIAPPPEPEPMMRKPIHCCSDVVLEDAFQSYLSMGEALATSNTEMLETRRAEFVTRVQSLGEKHALYALAQNGEQMKECAIDACREQYGIISDALVGHITEGHSGELDIAVAWSRKYKHHWIQQGNELRSPYGDGLESYSWGTRDAVEQSDVGREAQRRAAEPLGDPKGPAEGSGPPPIEADPPPGSNIAAPPEKTRVEGSAAAGGAG